MLGDEEPWEVDRGEGRVRARAGLVILSNELPPEELAKRLPLDPDRMWRKGDPAGLRGRRAQPFNGVEYHSELDDKRTPTDHLAALVERLQPHAAQIAAVAADPATYCTRLWVGEHSERQRRSLG
jgi:Domain of unknown function (DUF4279)